LANADPTTARKYLRCMAFGCIVTYVFFVGVLAILKGRQATDKPPWAEVFYGPAITVACCYLLVVFGVWLECLLRRKS
jgi:hypothetical protein